METRLTDGFTPHTPSDHAAYRNAGIFRDRPLWQLLADAADAFAGRLAVTDAETGAALTYNNFQSAVLRRAAGFAAAGLRPGQRVVLQQNNSVDFAITFFGLLRAGVIPVMTLPAHRIAEISHLAATSGAVAYITDDGHHGFDYRELAADLVAQVPSVTTVFVNGEPGEFGRTPDADPADVELPEGTDPDGPALLLVSGGTTGLPKLIARTHNDYEYNARRSAEIARLTADDVALVALPAAHNFPLCCPGLLGAVSVGAHTVFTTNPAPDNAFDLIEDHGITVVALVPALAQMWGASAEWEPADTSTLRLLQVGGAKLARADAVALDAAFPGAVQQVFGMAEGLICYTRLDDARDTVHSTQGRPMSELDDVRIIDADGRDVAEGVDGELLVKGPYTIRSYYNPGSGASGPHATAEPGAASFTPDGYYRSGDQVRRLADGNLVVTGRIKDTIVRAGENVAADDIEDRLLAHPSVLQAAIVGLPDPALGESICAAVVLASGAAAPSLPDVRGFLADAGLAAFKMPDRLAIVPSLPVTAVGKIDKRVLAARL